MLLIALLTNVSGIWGQFHANPNGDRNFPEEGDDKDEMDGGPVILEPPDYEEDGEGGGNFT